MNKNREILDSVAQVVKDIMNEDGYTSVDAATKRQIYNDTMDTVSRELRKRDDRWEFEKYYNQWIDETMLIASENKRYTNENYVAIVKMGTRALPFIGEKLLEGKISIVLACEAIYQKGILKTYSFSKAADAWIKKLREDGYLAYGN